MVAVRVKRLFEVREAKVFVAVTVAVLLALALALTAGPAAARCGIDDADCGPPEPEPLPPTFPANGEFEWSMENRFGRDDDRDGVTDYHWDEATATYDQSYVNPTEFKVNFDGCPTQEESDSAGTSNSNSYTWDFGDGTTRTLQNCRPSHDYTREGTFTAKLTYRDPSTNAEVGSEKQVKVQDYLIVSLGDSYGSGEGAVDRPIPTRIGWGGADNNKFGTWATGEAKWVDKRCHRSANAGAAQAARTLEYADPQSSVTFVSFACSGATINRETEVTIGLRNHPQGSGVLGPYRGIDVPWQPINHPDPFTLDPANWLPPQLDALSRTLAGCAPTDTTCENGDRPGRNVDSLVISGGGNDAYFADIVMKCMLESDCNQREDVGSLVTDGLGGLPARYDALATAVHNRNPAGRPPLDVSKVYLTQYPDPTTGDDSLTCGSMLGDIVWTKSITRPESLWARSQVINPLNQTMADAAARADAASADTDWAYVDDISQQFVGHGYCANARWIAQPMDSRRTQGPYFVQPFEDWELTNILADQKGMMHPNASGYRAYSNSLVPLLRSQLDQVPVSSLGPLPAFSAAASMPGATSKWGDNGWIVGTDGAGSAELNEASVTVAVDDPSGMASGAVVINGVNPCGTTNAVQCSVTDISLQRKEWRFRFRQDGIYRLEFVAQGQDGQSSTYVYEARVDLNDPEATAEAARPPDENGRYTSPVDVTLRGTDPPGGSGVYKIEYTIGDGPVQEIAAGDKVTLQPNETRLRYWSVDHAGRKSAVRDFIARDRIAFFSNRDVPDPNDPANAERGHVWATDTDGSFPTRITNSDAGDRTPAFSPDGKKVVFASLRAGVEDFELYVSNADGSNPIRLTDNAFEDQSPAWSPDGKKIIFASNRTGNFDIFTMNADGTGQTNVTSNAAREHVPAWSPDGARITFESNRDGNNEIYTANANGTNPTRVTNHSADDRAPSYSPDAKKITFSSNRDGNYEIYAMDAGGASPTRLTNNAALDQSSMYSQDGKKIAFASFRDGNGEIYVMNADGSNPTNVTRNPQLDNQPDWGLVYNDAFSASRAITGSSTSIAGSTLAASRETGEPNHYTPVPGDNAWPGVGSVWYRWTAPSSGTIELDLCETNFDTILSVYTGGSLGTLNRVKDNNNACPNNPDGSTNWGSKLTFEATAGTVYNIAVSGAGGLPAGIFTLKLGLVVDSTPPPPPVIASPTNNPFDRDGVFTVSGTAEPNSTIRLREGEEFKGGTQVGASGVWSARLTGISDGPHTYVAEASDRAGNTSTASNPATITVDTTEPETTITSGPSGLTNATSATFAFSSEPNASFECRLTRNDEDPSTFTLCQSPKSYPTLEPTGYTFEVRAVDAAGNPDPTPASRSWTVLPPPAPCTKNGTSGNDVISGTSGNDVICAGAGNDTVKGLGGNDILRGGSGNDKLLGGVGDDTLDGGLGADTASYSASLTAVTASLASNSGSGEGSDTFSAVENLLGSSKADTLTGSAANNTLTGGNGNDTERGGAGKDKLVGSGGADDLFGEDGSDTVNSKDGVSGNDRLDGGTGTDTKVTDTNEASIVGFP